MTNSLVPFAIYPLGPETQDEDTGKEERQLEKQIWPDIKPSQEETFHITPNSQLGSSKHFSGMISPVLWTTLLIPWS